MLLLKLKYVSLMVYLNIIPYKASMLNKILHITYKEHDTKTLFISYNELF